MIKLEHSDYKILEALIENSRLPLTKLSKFVHLSRENTNYRLNRLISLKVIKSLNAVLSTDILGLKQYVLFIQLNKINKQKESQIINSLKNHKSISWIGILTGKWSIALDIYAKDEGTLSKNLHEILNICEEHVGEYALLPLERKEYFIHKALNYKTKNRIIKGSQVNVKLDDKDRLLLRYLNENARIGYVELSKKFNLTANAMKKRIKNLQKENVIMGYTSMINYKTLGYEWYGLQLKLTKFDEYSISNFIKYLHNHPKVIFYYKYVSGFWNFDVGILVKDSIELREFINELRDKFPEEIKINDFFLLLEEITNNTLPKVAFES